MLSALDSRGSSPVWVTVLAARFIAGFVSGFFGFMVTGGAASGVLATSAGSASSARLVGVFVPMIVSAVVMGVAISMLLPQLSSRRVGLGNATVAAFTGAVIPVIAGLAVAHDNGAVIDFGTGGWLVMAPLYVLSIAVTSWMVASAATDLERWRDKPVPAEPRWSDIESIDRLGAKSEDAQAEHGYWGGMDSSASRPNGASESTSTSGWPAGR